MRIVKHIDALRSTAVPKPFQRRIKVVFSKGDGVSDMTVMVASIPPRGGTGTHSHSACGELMYVLQGAGWIDLLGKRHRLRPGTAAWAPPGIEHEVFNDGQRLLEILAVFAPPIGSTYINQALARARRLKQ